MRKPEVEENDIIRCLSEYESILRDVRERIQHLYTSVATTNDVLETIQISGKEYGRLSTGGGGKNDLADILEQYEENEKQYAVYLNNYISRLIDEEQELKRIWICYQSLPHKQRTVLKTLYVDHKAWKVAKDELRLSYKTLSAHRKAAIHNIQILYASSLTDLQILTQSREEVRKRVEKRKETGQISLWEVGMKKEEGDKK